MWLLTNQANVRSRAGFEHALGACVALLQRADDAEESIRDMVSRVFHGLWFAAGAKQAKASYVLKSST